MHVVCTYTHRCGTPYHRGMTENEKTIVGGIVAAIVVAAIAFGAAAAGPSDDSYAPDAEHCTGPYCY
jgi:hypothetical protein